MNNKLIIDSHAHIWDGDRENVPRFIKAMDELGIDKTVVTPIAPRVSAEYIGDICREYPDRLVGYASVMPNLGAYSPGAPIPRGILATDKLEMLVKDYGFKGVKLHPLIQGFSMTDPVVVQLVRKAAELKIPVLFHTGPGLSGRIAHGDLYGIDDLAIQVPEATIIMAHGEILNLGHYIVRKHKNVYMDTAASWPRICKLIKGIGEDAVKFMGAEKVLFATDANPRGIDRFKTHIDCIESLNITDREKKLILGENIKKLLNL